MSGNHDSGGPGSGPPEESAQDENRIIAERRGKLAALRERGNAFPNDFRRDTFAGDLHSAHGAASNDDRPIPAQQWNTTCAPSRYRE